MADGNQLHRALSFAQCIVLSPEERVKQSELRATRTALWTINYQLFDSWPRGLELGLCFRGIAAHQENARLKIFFRQWNASLRKDRVERGIGQGSICGIRFSVHQAHIPACEGDHAIGVEVRRERLEGAFNCSR